jgi:hypothetical protein
MLTCNYEDVSLCYDYGYDREEVLDALETEEYTPELLSDKEKAMLKLYHEGKFYI